MQTYDHFVSEVVRGDTFKLVLGSQMAMLASAYRLSGRFSFPVARHITQLALESPPHTTSRLAGLEQCPKYSGIPESEVYSREA